MSDTSQLEWHLIQRSNDLQEVLRIQIPWYMNLTCLCTLPFWELVDDEFLAKDLTAWH